MAEPKVVMYSCGMERPVEIEKTRTVVDSDVLDMNAFLTKCENEYLENKISEDDEMLIQVGNSVFAMHKGHCCLTVSFNPFQQRTVYIAPLPMGENVCFLSTCYFTYKGLF